MADHEHGSMDTTQSERAFGGMMQVMAYGSVIIAITLIFLAIVGT